MGRNNAFWSWGDGGSINVGLKPLLQNFLELTNIVVYPLVPRSLPFRRQIGSLLLERLSLFRRRTRRERGGIGECDWACSEWKGLPTKPHSHYFSPRALTPWFRPRRYPPFATGISWSIALESLTVRARYIAPVFLLLPRCLITLASFFIFICVFPVFSFPRAPPILVQ